MTTLLRILQPIGLVRDGARRSMLNFLAGGPAPDSEEAYKVCSIVPEGLDVSEGEKKDVSNISGGNCFFKEPGRKVGECREYGKRQSYGSCYRNSY